MKLEGKESDAHSPRRYPLRIELLSERTYGRLTRHPRLTRIERQDEQICFHPASSLTLTSANLS